MIVIYASMIIDGKKIAQEIIKRLKSQPTPKKILAAILVGEDRASTSFFKQKEKVAKELGVDFRVYKFEKTLKNDNLRQEVGRIANQKPVGGVIVQLPLPEHLNPHYILNVIPREKDVDVLGERALGAFYAGRNPILPPAIGTVEEILKFMNFDLKDKSVAVVGLGFLIGKPIAVWLMRKARNLYFLHQGSDFSILKQADLVISGTGKKYLIKPEMLKIGAIFIDFGYSFNKKGGICGDFDPLKIRNWKLEIGNLWYTPTPGGTGPILVAKIFENFYKLCSDLNQGKIGQN